MIGGLLLVLSLDISLHVIRFGNHSVSLLILLLLQLAKSVIV
jgi:hypothetical protein